MSPEERLEKGRQVALAKKAALVQQVEFGPPCTGCKHFIEHKAACGHLVYSEHEYAPLTGKLSVEWARTGIEKARSDDGLCGPEAVLREDKTPAWRTVWKELAFFGLIGFVAAKEILFG